MAPTAVGDAKAPARRYCIRRLAFFLWLLAAQTRTAGVAKDERVY
jgi:hypothetical protein